MFNSDNTEVQITNDEIIDCLENITKKFEYSKYNNNLSNTREQNYSKIYMIRYLEKNNELVSNKKDEYYSIEDKELLNKYWADLTDEIEKYEKLVSKFLDTLKRRYPAPDYSDYEIEPSTPDIPSHIVEVYKLFLKEDVLMRSLNTIADNIVYNINSDKNLMQVDKFTYRYFSKLTIKAVKRINSIYELLLLYLLYDENFELE